MISIISRFVAIVVLLGTFAMPHMTWAEEYRDPDNGKATYRIPAAQREAIVSTALRALRHITRARNAIHADDIDQARDDVQQAQELLALVGAARPTVRLKEHIWVARQHMDYETPQDVIDDLTLIDAELLNLAEYIPTAKARRHLQNARDLIQKNDTKAAKQELSHMEESLLLAEFDLPLAVSEQQVLAAQEALAINHPAAADKALVAAEESIQFITLGGSAPLVGTRTHLNRAAKNYADEYYAAARADLAQASEWLRRAGIGADEKSRKEAQKLAAEIDAVEDKLDTVGHADTLSKLLHRSAVLVERDAEDLWMRNKQQQAEIRTLRKLLDAKIHLYYSKLDLARKHDSASIRSEIQTADRYLEESLDTAEPAMAEQITRLRNELEVLAGELDSDRTKASRHYEQIMADLLHLMYRN